MGWITKRCTVSSAGAACLSDGGPLAGRGCTRWWAITTAAACAVAVLAMSAGVRAGSLSEDLDAAIGRAPAPAAPPVQTANSSLSVAAMPQTAQVGVSAPGSDDPAFVTIGGGYTDIFDHDEAIEFRGEWRSGRRFLWFKPFAGVTFTSDAAGYGYAGILTDFYFGRRIVITPSIAPGIYLHGGGKDLGSILEFRSGIEVGWRFDNRSRLSVMLYHISNAGIGDTNPGTEAVSLGYSIPLR